MSSYGNAGGDSDVSHTRVGTVKDSPIANLAAVPEKAADVPVSVLDAATAIPEGLTGASSTRVGGDNSEYVFPPLTLSFIPNQRL